MAWTGHGSNARVKLKNGVMKLDIYGMCIWSCMLSLFNVTSVIESCICVVVPLHVHPTHPPPSLSCASTPTPPPPTHTPFTSSLSCAHIPFSLLCTHRPPTSFPLSLVHTHPLLSLLYTPPPSLLMYTHPSSQICAPILLSLSPSVAIINDQLTIRNPNPKSVQARSGLFTLGVNLLCRSKLAHGIEMCNTLEDRSPRMQGCVVRMTAVDIMHFSYM